jgi:hypothetical protein
VAPICSPLIHANLQWRNATPMDNSTKKELLEVQPFERRLEREPDSGFGSVEHRARAPPSPVDGKDLDIDAA